MDDSGQNQHNIPIGGDLYGLSVAEINERIEILKFEIGRLEKQRDIQSRGLAEAQSLFGN